MKKIVLTLFSLLLLVAQPIFAQQSISLKFNRTGTNAESVAVQTTDENGNAINGMTVNFASSHNLKGTGSAVTNGILCPDANGNTNPTINLTFTINGIPAGFAFEKVALDIHALNGGGSYQANDDNKLRQWNVAATVNDNAFGSLDNIDIAAGIGASGSSVHQIWEIANEKTEANGTVTVKLTITKGTTNEGCFFGLSEVLLTSDGVEPAPEPEPEPEPEPVEGEGKVYLISWKNTGANYITEENDHRMTIQAKSVTKAQFWMFIPTENENCYYIKNTATGRYLGSCNLNPSSDSKITTDTAPVEYYVGKSSAKSGQWYLSSTDCANYNNESNGPRALNKDGASDYVITWVTRQNGTYDDGSYWKFIETADLYEICPFDASTTIGNIGASYNMETPDGNNLTFADSKVALASPDSFDENQEWYFVGAGDGTGYQVASASEPATVVGISDGNIVAGEGLGTKWKVNKGKVNGYYYLTSNKVTLKVDGDSLFRFTRLRSAYTRSLKIYNNPCGAVGNNYIKKAEIHGEGAVGNIIYEANSKPGKWHVMYAIDKGEVAKGKKFNIDVTLASSAANSLTAIAHFDWNSDGVFETAVPLTLNGTAGNAEVTVPEWAAETKTRMRLRVNSNGLDLAEDDVHGFIYDFNITVVPATDARTVALGVNARSRGSVELSEVADAYAYGTTLTAKATPKGDARFVCWREEGVVVSTDAEYTFTVDRNVKLVAYFSPNTLATDEDEETCVKNMAQEDDITFVLQGNQITATGNCKVTGMALYTTDAAIVARSNGNVINTANIKEGVYIISATTENGYRNCKIYLNK